VPGRSLTLILATVMALGSFAPAQAAGVSGSYLAARQASFLGDYTQAAEYYSRALQHDPENGQLLERGVLAFLSLGDVARAQALADQIEQAGLSSQLAFMAQLVAAARDEQYASIIERIEADKGIGPLVDGLMLAWSRLGDGDMSGALVGFDEVAKEPGLSGFAMYHKALALASVGDFESAEALFAAEAAGAMQMTRRGVVARSEIMAQLGQREEAVQLIDSSFGSDLDPELTQLRSALLLDGDLPYRHVRSARDGVAEVFFTLAGALSNEADDDYTLLYARMAVFIRPDHIDAVLMSADLLDQLGQYDLAVKTYKLVPRDHPSFHAAELGRADALRGDDKVEAAVEVLESLAQTHGDLAVVQSTLGDVMRILKRFDEATQAYDRALATFDSPSRAQWFLYYARAISHERQGSWDAAEADFRAALDLNPDQPQVLNYLGYSLVERQEKLDEALDMIQRAAAAQPQSGYIVDSLGWVLYRLGRYDEAVVHMERAAELMPVDPVVNDHLGDVYWAVGRELEAQFQWKRALSFVDEEDESGDADPVRIRGKLARGLDAVLAEEGAPPLVRVANDDG